MTRFLLISVLLILFVWIGGFFTFLYIIQLPPPSNPQGEAAVALTGGKDRLEEAYRLLEKGAVRELFISGVGRGVKVKELFPTGVPEISERISLGYKARSTYANAEEVAGWLQTRNYIKVILVTSNYHLPRSLVEFREAMPQVEWVPYPVAADTVRVSDWWRYERSGKLLWLEYNKFLIVRLRAWL